MKFKENKWTGFTGLTGFHKRNKGFFRFNPVNLVNPVYFLIPVFHQSTALG
jgi:hypothetical protein